MSPAAQPTAGRAYDNEWKKIDLADDWTIYVRTAARIAAATRGPLVVEYRAWQGSFPSELRLRSDPPGGAAADLTLVLSQMAANVDLAAEAFTIEIPREAQPLTLEELRLAGPLGAR